MGIILRLMWVVVLDDFVDKCYIYLRGRLELLFILILEWFLLLDVVFVFEFLFFGSFDIFGVDYLEYIYVLN